MLPYFFEKMTARKFDNEIYEAATEGYDPHKHARALQRHLDNFARAAREDLGVPVGTTQDED